MYDSPFDALVPFGWGPRVHALFSDVLKRPGAMPGRVTRAERDFCRVVAECKRARVLVEELMHVTSPSWAPPAWSALSTAGAHDHLELIGTAQRPTMIDKNFVGNCTDRGRTRDSVDEQEGCERHANADGGR